LNKANWKKLKRKLRKPTAPWTKQDGEALSTREMLLDAKVASWLPSPKPVLKPRKRLCLLQPKTPPQKGGVFIYDNSNFSINRGKDLIGL
jgi:hypothetical protein